jgi:hypothetical protein
VAIVYPANTAKMPLLIQTPNSVLDHTFDWTEWLDALNDTISVSTWVVPSGLELEAETHNTKLTSAFISGGTLEETYIVTNHILTAGGREDERSFKLKIVAR